MDREVDLRKALDDYLAVASLHSLWSKSDQAYRYANNPEIVQTFNLNPTELRQRGKHRDRLYAEFESALVEATNTHGPLGVAGNEYSSILSAIRELELFALPNDQLRKKPGLRTDATSVHPRVIARIRDSMASCDIIRGGVECPDLYSALLWYVHVTDLPFRVCDVCETAFVTRKGKTCSDRCRQRLRYQQQSHKHA